MKNNGFNHFYLDKKSEIMFVTTQRSSHTMVFCVPIYK